MNFMCFYSGHVVSTIGVAQFLVDMANGQHGVMEFGCSLVCIGLIVLLAASSTYSAPGHMVDGSEFI